MEEKKIHKFFIGILILEIILIIILHLFFQNPCGSACATRSTLNPFGFNEPEACMTVCEKTQNILFYPLVDLMIITLLVHLLIIFKTKVKGGKK